MHWERKQGTNKFQSIRAKQSVMLLAWARRKRRGKYSTHTSAPSSVHVTKHEPTALKALL